MSEQRSYPSNFGPGTHWAVDAAWEILDTLKVGVLNDTTRTYLAGMIAGRLMEERDGTSHERQPRTTLRRTLKRRGDLIMRSLLSRRDGHVIRALVIDSVAREVREVELPDAAEARLAEMTALIGGYLETAYIWPFTRDVLFVDEDWLWHDWGSGFLFAPPRHRRSLLGNGVVLGQEVESDEYPDGWTNLDPKITADELRRLVSFFRR